MTTMKLVSVTGYIWVWNFVLGCTLGDGSIHQVELSVWEDDIARWEAALDPKPAFTVNTAWLTVKGVNISDLVLYEQNDQCYQCDVQLSGSVSNNGTTRLTQSAFGNYLEIRTETDQVLCSDHVTSLDERGDYWLIVFRETPSNVTCNLVLANDPPNYNLPILWAFLVLVGLGLIWIIIKIIYKRARRGRHESHDISSNTTIWKKEEAVPGSGAMPAATKDTGQVRKKTRLRSLDTFRGLSLIVMIFVNYGGGGYYFFEHAHWDGLYVADLVFPWFVWIMGVSVPFSLRGQMRRGKPKSRIFLRILERTIKLFFIGICLGARNSQNMKTIRIPGVLQRLGFTYFVTAAVHLCFVSIKDEAPMFVRCCKACRPLRDIFYYWPEWIIMLVILNAQLCLTYLLPVPGCPTGYVGPGGLHKGGLYFNCTGGAAQYIDRIILTENNLFQWPTIQGLYKTTMPFDPEGILGTLTSIFMCFLGLQAGKIIVMYPGHVSRIVRWLLWAILTGVIGAVLCKGSQFEGWVPLNKNLWSVSFILVLTSMAYFLLIILYLIIDIAKIWNGAPFIYPGMNSIVVYICHTVFSEYFPVAWEWPDYTLHWQRLFRALWGSTIWVIVAFAMYFKKIFIAL